MNPYETSETVMLPAVALVDILTDSGRTAIEAARSLLEADQGNARLNPEYLRGISNLIANTTAFYLPHAHRVLGYDDIAEAVETALTQTSGWL